MTLPSHDGSPARRIGSVARDDLHLLIDSVTDYAIFLLDPSGRVVSWNTGARRIKGYEAGEIIGEHFSKFYLPEDVAAGKPEQELAIARQVCRVEDEGWRVRKDGSLFWANVVITALWDDQGLLRGFGKVTRDLTQRRASEVELRRAEQRFHQLVDAVADYSIFMLDSTGHVATWNPGARKTKGYEASEIIGRHFSAFYTPEDRQRGKPEQVLETVRREGRFEEEGWRVRKDGTRFWANIVINMLRNEQGQAVGFAKVTRDLTTRRAAEETARELAREQAARAVAESMARKAEEANRIKDEFLATVSHELRTPLNAIVGWSSILRQRQLDPAVSRAIEIIERNAHAQVKIIEDILDVSRIITGKLRIDPRPTDLISITNQAIEVVRHSASAKQIIVDFPQSTEECSFVGDPERVQQVVWNLLSNAIKFTSSGGSVHIDVQRTDAGVTLSVTDTGLGIDPDFLPYLFERFKQGDSSTTRRFGGLGLGLAIVRHIAELHGGSVSASSAGRGHGSTISVTFPLRAVAPQAEVAAPAIAPLPPLERGPLDAVLNRVRVLLVEDDADARELVGAILVEAGAVVKSVSSASAAIEALSGFRPQLLVSDIAMPDEDGYSLIRRIRALDAAHGGAIPSLALTAYTRTEDRTKALAAGFTTHIGKPVNPKDLIAALGNLAAFVGR
jgi:PAS domain S-box-containing protein